MRIQPPTQRVRADVWTRHCAQSKRGNWLTATTRMSNRFLVALLLVVQPLVARAADLQYMGDFHNVSSRDGGEHCAGYSLGLWKHQERVLGLLHLHAGLCGDPPCAVIRDTRLDSRTGRLEFWSSILGQKIRFEGTVTPEAIDGVFNGQRARLTRDPDRTSLNFEPNRSISAWCTFWISVPRCSGVRELCESIRVLGIKSGG